MNNVLGFQVIDKNSELYGTIFIKNDNLTKVLVSKTLKDNEIVDNSTFDGVEVKEVHIAVEPQVEGAQHLNVNVMNKEMMQDAINNPGKYPNLVVRISGYACRFDALTPEQKADIVTRTFHKSI